MGASGLLANGAPPVPAWVTMIRYAIVGLSVIILGLGAWSIAIFGQYAAFYGASSGGMVIFTVIWTWLVYGGSIAAELFFPHLFYRLVFLIGYIFAVIFWLSAWAWSASLANFWLAFQQFGASVSSETTQVGAALAGCAGLGAVVWVLTILHLAFFIRGALQQGGNHQAELGNIKHEHQAPGVAYPAATYPAPQPTQYPQPSVSQPPVSYGQPAPYGQTQPYATQ